MLEGASARSSMQSNTNPVVIRRRNRDVCVIMSIEEYERIQHLETKDPKWAQVDSETDGS